MAIRNTIIAAVITTLLSTPAVAASPETITGYCAEMTRVNAGSTDAETHYRAGFVIGFLDAVTESLGADGWKCPPIDGQQFCDLFKRAAFLGGGAFSHARGVLLQVCKQAG
ncbi:MAG: hypothetical protein WCH04_19920 [Gammaproteobacteria bacterium]